MNTNLVKEVAATQLRTDLPEFSSGDTVKVSVKITEGGKSRIQVFEGVVMARRGGGVGENLKVVCKRFLDSGMTPEQVAERMNVPIKFINACMR